MKIKRIKKRANVGMFFVEVTAYVDGDGGMRMLTSKAVDLEDIKKFMRICEDLRGTGTVRTLQAIRQMKDGATLEGWFEKYLFDGYWPSLARIANHKVFQISEDGIYEVEITE